MLGLWLHAFLQRYSLFIPRHALFITHYPLLATQYSLLNTRLTHHVVTDHSSLTTHYSPVFNVQWSLLVTHYSLTTHRGLTICETMVIRNPPANLLWSTQRQDVQRGTKPAVRAKQKHKNIKYLKGPPRFVMFTCADTP